MGSIKWRGYAKKYEEEKERPLLKNLFDEYKKNETMHEYHIDTYHKFSELTPTMSIRSDHNSHPIMIIG